MRRGGWGCIFFSPKAGVMPRAPIILTGTVPMMRIKLFANPFISTACNEMRG